MGTNLPTSAGITSIWLLATTVAMDFAGSMISFSWQGLYIQNSCWRKCDHEKVHGDFLPS